MASSWKLGAGMISWTVARLDAHIRIIKLAQHKQCKCSSSAKFQQCTATKCTTISAKKGISRPELARSHVPNSLQTTMLNMTRVQNKELMLHVSSDLTSSALCFSSELQPYTSEKD
eukprot:scaffold65451_cov13-Tisochrysis_lutea.AAC.2